MQAVRGKELLPWLLVPAQHRAVNVEERHAIVAAADVADHGVRRSCAVDGEPALRARLDPDEDDARLRQPRVNGPDEPLELDGDILGCHTRIDVIVAAVDDDYTRLIWNDDPLSEADGVDERRAPQAPIGRSE